MRIAIASDHAAFALKELLVAWLGEQGHEVADLGPHSDARVDYPDYGYALAEHVAAGKAERGIALVRLRHRHLDRGQPPSRRRCALVGEPLSARALPRT